MNQIIVLLQLALTLLVQAQTGTQAQKEMALKIAGQIVITAQDYVKEMPTQPIIPPYVPPENNIPIIPPANNITPNQILPTPIEPLGTNEPIIQLETPKDVIKETLKPKEDLYKYSLLCENNVCKNVKDKTLTIKGLDVGFLSYQGESSVSVNGEKTLFNTTLNPGIAQRKDLTKELNLTLAPGETTPMQVLINSDYGAGQTRNLTYEIEGKEYSYGF